MRETLVILVLVVLIALLAYDIAIVLENNIDDLALHSIQDSSEREEPCEHGISNQLYYSSNVIIDRLMLWLFVLH